MGLNDDAEMLAAAQAQSVQDERQIAALTQERDNAHLVAEAVTRDRDRLRQELTAAGQLVHEQARQLQEQTNVLFQAGERTGILWRERYDLEQQIDAVRQKALHYDGDIGETGTLAQALLEIIGAQQPATADEHDRSA